MTKAHLDIDALIARIKPLDEVAMQSARARQDVLTKPRGSLGRLEELSIKVAGMTAHPTPRVRDKAVIIMAGDHGVVQEGVSAYPQEVTRQMVLNFLRGGAAINVFARQAGARVTVADLGLAADLAPQPGLVIHKIGHGTANLSMGPAMTRAQAVESVLAGANIFESELAQGLDIVATGDMGIGNTTPSAAIAAALSGASLDELVGRGTGLDDAGLERKRSAILRGLELNQPDSADGLDVLSKLGGFEIGGLAGVVLAAAANRKPVVIDGFISGAAAMIAVSMAPAARGYLVAAHVSAERGHRIMLSWLGLEPLLDLDMRLGEGTGAALALHLIDAACRTLTEMATFEEAGVSEQNQ